MSTAGFRHTPVLLDRCVELLSPALQEPGAVAIDATLGLGGHTEALLAACPGARVVGIDRDAEAIRLAGERLDVAGDRFASHHATYDDIAGALATVEATHADAILFDLGVSSLQIDEADRGFSYAQDAPLDMRMNRDDPVTAASLLATESEDELTRILHVYGEERFARKIARSIVRRRESEPIERSAQLVDLVRACIPAATRTPGSNPAKRTFQALRIAVNSELDVLEAALVAAIDALRVGGRIVVLSYHSLEDRIVKHAFAEGTEIAVPPGMPVVPDDAQPYLRLLTRGAEKAPEAEIEVNSRAKPVRLRAAERTRATPRRAA
ncbi:16S rRNA (cytosine(1402)-N(4))-methyltransferase RsmH [Demequina sp.]|uniref:16S rRNA (cytosine(1402)-N(4))-methyltransferase RsmH n=1 Tax=Demequina sp. TaxID=2050685 RepID=UPI0025C3B15D|nr:16S rRNA (cytosine(1402)-N(4))-methyltransferase RsmH [Demequina sp.]